MTTELTKAAQQALKPHQIAQLVNKLRDIAREFHAHDCLRELISQEVNSTLAQRPAAQAGDGPISASLGDIVALWDQHAPSEYMTAIHMQAKRALAGQQPMSPDMARWCAYVGGMVAHWVKSEPDALARLGDDAFEAAIAGIIERRLWAMPKPAPQQATPEPVGDVRCEGCGYMTHHREHMGCVRAAKQHTHPAPDGWTEADADAARLAMELECLLLDTKDTAAVSRWWKSANEALDLHRARLAAAQAKGSDK